MIFTTNEHLLYKLCYKYLKNKLLLKMFCVQTIVQVKMGNASKLFSVPVSVVAKLICLVKIVLERRMTTNLMWLIDLNY